MNIKQTSKDYQLRFINVDKKDGSSEAILYHPDGEGVMVPTRKIQVSGFLSEIYKSKESDDC